MYSREREDDCRFDPDLDALARASSTRLRPPPLASLPSDNVAALCAMGRRPACLILLLSVCGAEPLGRRKVGKRHGGLPRERLEPWCAALPAA